MKNIYRIIIIVFLFVLSFGLISCSNEKKAFEDDYQMFKDKEHVFVKADYKTVYASLTKEKGSSVIVFAYDPDLYVCPFCMKVFPILNEVALEAEVEEILYLDIRTMRVERTAEYLSLIEYISDQVDDLELRDDKLEIIVPDVYVVQDGKILGHHIATIKDEEGKYIVDINDEQTSELKDIYRSMFQKVK